MTKLGQRRPNIATAFIQRFVGERRGNVAIIVCAVMVVLVFGAGAGIDYTMANRRQDQINGFADAAALAAVTPAMMGQSDDNAKAAAQAMFLSQLATIPDINYSANNVTITAVDTPSATTVNRTITISYAATSSNMFASVLGAPSLAIGGTASATSAVAPRIDFYMLLDTSPSMAIAATTTGIDTMIEKTPNQIDPTTHVPGCAFACHESSPANDKLGNPGGEDNYALARSLSPTVALRIDNVETATYSLMSNAQTTAITNNTDYRAAIYTMDYSVNQLIAMTDTVPKGGLTALQAAAANIQAVEVYDNNCLTASNCNSDEDSSLDQSLQALNTAMPQPGNGTSNSGDSPQEVLFIVSDGANDELATGGAVGQTTSGNGRIYGSINHLFSTDQCAAIKNRGIRIAYLYLTYYPLWTNGWYKSYIMPFQFTNPAPIFDTKNEKPSDPDSYTPTNVNSLVDNIASAAQACASPGLYFAVDTGGDVNAAMIALFQKAVSTAHLTH